MRPEHRTFTILMAEDDEDDRLLTEEAFREAGLNSAIEFVKDGEELMDYLAQRGRFREAKALHRPSLILLDLNMPRKDGREVLKEIKKDPQLKRIPIIILTTSQDQEDIDLAYDLGANSFVAKPSSFEALVKIIRLLGHYWFEMVELPHY